MKEDNLDDTPISNENAVRQEPTTDSNLASYISELSKIIQDPIHQRLLNAYRVAQSVAAMEKELANIVTEVITDEA